MQPNNSEQKNIISGTSVNQPVTKASTSGGPLTGYQVPKPTKRVYGTVGSEQPLDDTSPALKEAPLITPAPAVALPYRKMALWSGLALAVVFVIGTAAVFLNTKAGHKNLANSSDKIATTTDDPLQSALDNSLIKINRNTTINSKTLTATGDVLVQNESVSGFDVMNQAGDKLLSVDTKNNQVKIAAAPGSQVALQASGNILASGSLQASNSGSSLSNQGLVINSVLVCTAAGCNSKTSQSLPDLSVYAKQSDLLSYAKLSSSQTFTGVNTFQGKVGVGAVPSAGGAQLQVSGNVDVTGNFSVNGTSGTSLTCPASQLLQQPVIIGGIITSGVCVPGAGASVATLQESYDASIPASVVLSSASGPLQLQDGTTPLGTDLFEVTSNGGGTKYFSVSATGTKVNGSDVCTTAGNCSGVGGGVTTAGGTTNQLTKFTGSQSIGDSIISDNGTTVTVGGTLNATVVQQNGIGVLTTNTNFAGDISGTYNSTVIGVGAVNSSKILDGTITDADISGTAGIAYSKLNLTGNIVNGDISAVASISYSKLNLNGSVTNNDIAGGAAIAYGKLALNNSIVNADISSSAAITDDKLAQISSAGKVADTALSANVTKQGNTFNGANQLVQTDASSHISNTNLNSDVALTDRAGGQTFTTAQTFNSSITAPGITAGGAALGIGASGDTLNLNGNYNSSLAVTDGAHTTTVGFSGTPTANVTYDFDVAAATGAYTICTTAGNCTGVSGGAVGGSGTAGKIAKFTGSGFTVGDSILSDNGTTVSVGGTLNATTLQQAGTGVLLQTTAFSGDVSGAYSATSVDKLKGTSLSISSLADTDFLIYNSTSGNWENHSISGDLTVDNSGAASIGTGKVTSLQIADGTITNTDISTSAGITDDKLAQISSAGKVADSALSANVTKQGNTFNGNNELVQTDGSGKIGDGLLSTNVALHNANNTFTGNNVFSLNTAGLAVQDAATPLGTNLFEIDNNDGTTKYFTVSATALQFLGNDVCTASGNCAGTSSGIGGSGTGGKIAKFTGSGTSYTVGDSLISDNGTTVTVGGTLAVNTITPTATLTVGTPTQTLSLQGDGSTSLSATSGSSTNSIVFVAPTGNHTINVPDAAGTIAVSASGPLSLDAAGNLTCPTCLTSGGGGTAGVSSVNSLTGAITLAGTTNEITITPSSNTLTFSLPQTIDTGSTPDFAGIKIGGSAISSSDLSDSASITLQGNTFNGNNELVQTDGSGHISNTNLNSDVALTDRAGGQTFTTDQLIKETSATAFQVQDSSTNSILVADSTNNRIIINNLSFGGTGNISQTITKSMVVTSAVNAHDVVIIDSANPGQVTTTSTPNSNLIYGVATATKAAGQTQDIVIGGTYQVNVDATSTIAVGDFIATSGTTGEVTTNNNPAAGTILGRALSAITVPGAGQTVWVQVTPDVGGGSAGTGVTSLGSYTHCTAYADGAQISGTTLTLGCADATHPGLIDTQAQTFAGDKTFSGTVNANLLQQGGEGVVLQNTAFSGDVSGPYNSTSVDKLKGTSLSINTLADTDFLIYNSTSGNWENHSVGGDIAIDHTGAATIQTGAVDSSKIADGTITNTDISGSAAIAYSKLNLGSSIAQSDLSSSLSNSLAYLAGNQTFSGTNSFQNSSATAFQVQSASAAETLLTVDTTARSASGGNLVKIGNSTGTDADTTILVLDGASAAPSTDLSVLSGGLFYNTNTNHIDVIENGAVKELCNKTDLGCGSAGPVTTLNGAYINGSSAADQTINLTSGDGGGVVIKDQAGGLGSTLFGVQDSTGGTKYLDISAAGSILTGQLTFKNTSDGQTISVNQGRAGGQGIIFSNNAGNEVSYIHMLSSSDNSLAFCANNNTSSCPLGQEQFILNSQNGGAAKFRNSANSISGFQVQNASGSNLFNIDTTNGIVGTIATSVASTNSNSLTLQTGNATGTTSNSGNVSIDVGTATGTTGTISIGTANASAISIGKTGLTTVNNGSLTVAQNLTANNLLSSVADGASAVGFTLNTSNTLATTGSKLLSLQNNGSEKLSVDKGGNLSAAGVSATGTVSGSALSSNSSLTFSNSAQGFIQQSMTSGGVIGIKHVVVLNSSNQVVETTTPRDVNIYGVANGNASGSGQAINIITYGTADVAVDTATVNIGDQLVASSTGGLATVDDSATTGIIGIARTFKAGGATGSVTAQISPVRGVYTPHFIPGSDSATAFQIQSALAADTLFTADTTARSASGGNLVKIGNSTGTDADTTILVVDSASSAPTSDLGALNGGLFYNSTTNHLNVIENGQVKELCNKTDLGCGTAAPATTLAGSYANGSSQTDEMIALDSTRNGVLIRDNATPIGGGTGTLFGVQDSTGGTKYLDVTTSGIAVTGTIKASNTSNASLITVNSSHAGSRGIDFYNSSDGSLSYIHNNNASPVSGLSFCLNSTNSSCARDQIIFGQGGTASFRNSTDSSTAFQIQNASGAQLLNVDTTASANLITNGGFESGATGWTVKNGSTLTQVTTQQWQGNGSLQIAAGASANSGASYAYTLSPATSYALSLYARAASGTITDLVIGRQDVSGTDINCATSATLTTSWQRLTCTFTTGATITSSNIYVQTTGTGSESFYIDGVQLQTGSTTSAFNAGGALQFDGIINSPLAIQNKSDSANAFQVQSAAGTNILNVDSTGQSVSIGQPALYTTASGGIFSAKSDYTTDANPNSVTTADFNGDGKSDLATVNATGTVSILLGNGDGTFQAKTSFSLGAVTTRVLTSADVNNDGKVDLLVSNDTASVVDVLLGNGDGTFQAAVGYPDNINDYSITTADFNKDGYLDVLTAHYGASAVCVLLNNGNGTFGTKTCYSTGSFADFATTGDLNNDGYADIISGDHTGNLSTFLNNGNGTFGTRKDVTSSGDIDSIAVGDFNGDGKLDAAAANTIPGTVGVRLGNGDGTFQAATNYTVGSSPKSIVAGDFNSDGKLDLVVANSGGSSLSLLLGNGDGTFQAQQTLTTGSAPYFVTTGNFNGDSFPDLAATNNGSSSVSVFLGNVEKITHAGLSVSTTTAQQAGLIIQGVSSQQADLLRVQNVSGNPVFDVSGSGAALFQNATDSTTAFQIQNAAGSNNLLTADTTNTAININGNTSIGSALRGDIQFSDGFESGNGSFWSGTSDGVSSVQSAVVHSGRYAYEFNNSGGSASTWTVKMNQNTIYARAWVYVASQTSATAEVFGLTNGGNGNSWIVQRTTGGQVCVNSANCGGSFTAGAWHEIELQVTIGAGTGVTNLWLDGTQIVNLSSQANGTVGVQNLEIGDHSASHTITGYLDDITASTMRNSTSNALNVSDFLSVQGNSAFNGQVVIRPNQQIGSIFNVVTNSGTSLLNLGNNNGTETASIHAVNTTIQSTTNSTAAFQIQNAAGTNNLLTADTVNNAINVSSDLNVGTNYGKTLMADDFESGTTSLWDPYVAGIGPVIVSATTPAPVYHGKYAVKFAPSSSPSYLTHSYGAHGDNTTSASLRAWVYVPAGGQSSTYLDLMETAYNYFNTYWTVQRDTSGHLCIDSVVSGGYNGEDCSASTSFTTDAWHEVELTVTTGASTGSAQAWLDGASVVSLSGKNYTSNNLGYIIAGSLQNANIGTYYEDTITAYEDSNEHPVSHSINVDENLHVSGSAVMGETIISPAYSSTQAFQVLNSSNASLFTVDTVNYAVNTYASALFKNQGNSTAAFQVQNAGGSQILGIDTTIDAANLITNGSFETNTSGWAAKNGSGTSTLSQVTSGTTAPYIGAGSMQIATSGADSTNAGASYSRNFVNSTQYTLSLFVKASGSPITTLQIGRSNDNTTDTSCLSLAAIPTTGWTKVSCTFTYTGTTGTSYVYIKQTDSANHTWFIDGVKLEAAASATPYKEGGISLTGNITSAVTIQNQADSTNAFQVQTSGGSSVLNVDTLNRQVVYNTTLGGTVTLGSPSALPGIVFANSDGTGRSQIRQTSTGGGLSFGATSGNGIPANQFTLSNTGTALFQNSTNSTAAFQVQNAAGASLINVDTTATVNLITNGAFESMATTGWTVKNGSTLAQVTTQQWQGNNSMQIVGSASNNTGASYAYTLSPSTQYSLSFYAKVASGSISDLAYGRQDIAGTDSNCSSANAVSTKWTKYTCTFTTGATITSSNIYVQTTGTGSETFFIDGVQLQTGSTATAFNAGGALQFGGIINSPVAIQNTSNSGNAFQVENAAGINVLNVDTQNSAVTVKTGFYVQSSTGTNNFSVNATNGRVSIGSVTPNAALEIRPFNSDANIQLDRADTGGSVSTFSASSTGLTVATTGSTIFKPTTGNDSTTAFQIQSSGGSALLNADTLGGKITINQIGAYSDDFNSGGPTAGSQWSFVTSDSSTYSVNSALAGDLRIIPATPTTAYDCWTTQCNDPRLTETAPTGNFQADVKLDTLPPVTANSTAGQGLMLYKDSSDFIRFEIQATGVANTWKVAAHKVISGVGTDNIITSPNLISLTAPIYLRVTRSLDTWTLYYSTNGTTFTSAGSFTQSLDLSSAGSVLALYMGNSTTGTMPSFPNADFDYLHVYTGSATVLQVAGAANFQNAYDSTTAFQVQNSSGRDLLSVDTTNSAVSVGNTTDGSQISLAASGNANATITKNMPVTGTVNAHDLVVIDNLNDGHVTTTTTANDPKVFGIATGSGTPQDIVIGGTYQVNLISTNQAIVPGDYLVSTTTAGQVDKATGVPPSGTAIGQALQTVAANTGGTIWVYVTPGEGGTGVGGSTTLQQAYDYSTTSPQITLDNSPGAGGLIVQDNSTPLIGSLFTVQGNGCASATCKYLDVSASGVAIAGSLSVSSTITSTGVITANGGISVAANQTISMAGGATGSRPASPTKGTLYYDTSTNQLVQYNGTKWQAPSKNNTEIVAPSAWTGATAAQLKAEQDAADFVATGTDDGTTINSALSALPATGGGTVYLLPGTYTLGTTSISVPNNTTLTGSGDSTILTYPNSFGSGSTNYYAIKNSDTSTGTNVTVKDLLIDGNGSTQTAGLFFGVYFNGMGASTTRTGGRITDITTQNLFGNSIAGIILNNSFNNILTGDTSSNNFFGIYLQNSSNNTLNGNIAQGGDYGIVASSSNNNVLTSNTTQNNSSFGIELTSSSNNTLTGNIAQGNSASGIDLFSSSNNNTLTANTAQGNFSFGLYFNSSNNNTITGNTTQGNGTSGIYLYSASDNNISSNKLHDNGGSTANNALYLSNSSTKNSITSNDITDNAVANSSCTTTCYAINISDAGSTANYISANHILGDGTHAASIANPNNDTETFANQPLTENGDASFRNATDSAAAFQVQKASGTTLMNIDTSGNNIAVGITGSTNANSTIHLADSSAGVQTVTIGSTNSTSSTTLQGGTGAGAISLQAASTGTILIGTNNANTITLGGNTTLAAGKTLTVTGGTTGSRPASPTKGTLFYDTSTNNLIQYNGTKWVSAPKSNTFIVAASNSTQAEKDAADYVAPGTGDQATINNIFTNLAPCNTTGCSVYLMEGTYYLSAAISVPDNSTLEGSGASTIITVPNAQNGSYNMIQNTDTTTGTNVTIQNLLIDGNKANQTSGTMEGIYFNAMGAGSGSGARNGGNITNVITKNIYSGTGIYLSSSNNNTVTGNSALGNDNYGIYLSSSNNNTVTGNSAQGNGGPGIFLDSSSNNNLSGNTAQGNGDGIYLSSSNNNTVTGNTPQGNSFYGVYLSSSNNNTVTGNTPQGNSFYGVYLNSSSDNNLSGNKLHDNGGSTDNNGIYLDASSTKNSITGNDITDTGCTTTCYAINISDVGSTGNYLTSNHFLGDGTHAASINDATSGGNTYSNQPLTENGDASFRNGTNSTTAFQIQNASGASLFTVDTTNNTITLGAASANPVLLVLGNKNTSGDPTCTSGAIYYNSNTNRFRACTNGTWATFGAYAPGYELGYAQTTSNTTITATTEAGATTILTSPAVTYDGNTVVQIQVYIPEINDATSLGVGLWLDGTEQFGKLQPLDASGSGVYNLSLRLTPSSGSHTYTVRAWSSAGTGTAFAGSGSGGASSYPPAYIRISVAN